MVTDQRRLHERFTIDVPVVIVVGNARVTGRTQNVSLGGMLVTLDAPVVFGTAVVMHVRLPSLPEELELAGTVRWVEDGSVGVQFGSLRAKAAWALNQLFKEPPR